MGPARPPSDREARLVGVQFPRVDGEHERLAGGEHSPDRPRLQAEGEQPQIRAARRGHIQEPGPECRQRKFGQASSLAEVQPVRPALRARHSIPAARDRKDARVVPVPFLKKNGKRPHRPGHDRVGGRPVAGHFLTTQVLKQGTRAADVLPKAGGPWRQTGSCANPREAISCPADAMRRTRMGCRSAVHPNTKKVAFVPLRSRSSSTPSAFRSVRSSKVSHRTGGQKPRSASAWK